MIQSIHSWWRRILHPKRAKVWATALPSHLTQLMDPHLRPWRRHLMKSWATPHSHKTRSPVSGAILHNSQLSSTIILRRARFTRVGRIFWHPLLHPKTLILFGTFKPHSFVHTSLPLEPVEHSDQFSVLRICLATWYPDFTVCTFHS